MPHRMRDQVGTAGLIVAIVALIAALGGGAYAASGGLSGKQKKEVKKIAKLEAKKYAKRGPRGKNGQNGLNGTNGAPGAKGATGAAGATGPQGPAGANGTNGAPGAGVTIAPYIGEECPTEEGTQFSNGTGIGYACNGENGETGFSVTLPAGETEHGTWTVGPIPAANELVTFTPLSFNIPLATEVAVHYMGEEAAPTTECPGTYEEPAAKAGNLCVYSSFEEETTFLRSNNPERGNENAGLSGGLLVFELGSEEAKARGTWVVTAP